MKRWVRAWCIVCLTAAGLFAAPLIDEPVGELALGDGTVLRNAQARGFLTKVVLVRHQDGIRTVAYELFPEQFQAALALKRQGALAAAEKQAQLQPPPPPARPPGSPSAVGSKWEMAPTCRLYVTGSHDSVVTLRIENVSEFVVAVYPWQIVAKTQSGALLSGAHWVGLNNEGNVVMTLRSRQLIDGRSAVTLDLAVSPALANDTVDTVSWK